MNYTIVIPSIYQPYTGGCVTCIHPKLRDNLLIVDNTKENKGVAASWNLGIDRMKETGSEWLIILSASVRFGNMGGLDLIEQLETTRASVIEPELDFMWHCMSIRRNVIEKVGKFDENFYPAYFEDFDYGHRIRLTFENDPAFIWTKVFIDMMSAGRCHGTTLGGVKVDSQRLRDYLIKKWGGMPGDTKFTRPFNNPNNPLSYWELEEETKRVIERTKVMA